MGRQKPRVVLNLSQHHKQFKQRVHILNSALSNQTNIKTRNHAKIDQDSFISLQTKNSNTFTPNLIECILFPIFTATHSKSHSAKTIDLITKRSQNKRSKHKKNTSQLLSTSSKTLPFHQNFDINPNVYINKGPQPLLQSVDHFIKWHSRLLVQHIEYAFTDHINHEDNDYDADIYVPDMISEQWPSTYGDHNQYINPNFIENKESPYDVWMLRCAQRCFGDIVLNELTFDDFVRVIENRYNYYYWNFHENDENKTRKRIHFNKQIAQLCRNINTQIHKSYATFLKKEMEFRLSIIMGNKKLLKQERSAHIASLSLYAIQKSMDKIGSVIDMIDLEEINVLGSNIILKWTQNIRDCIGNIECLLKDIEELKYMIIEHLYQFESKFKKYLSEIKRKINEKNTRENVEQKRECSFSDMALIYIYKTNEALIHRDETSYDILSENMYKKNGDKDRNNRNEYEVHIDMELCDFGAYLNLYRYILSVLFEFRLRIDNEYKGKLNNLLKCVGGEIEGSIWWRQIWEEREYDNRVKMDEQISKKLLFLGGNNVELILGLIRKYNIANLSKMRVDMIVELQRSMIDYVARILNQNETDIDITSLAIHIKLNLLNNNDYVRMHLLKKMYEIIHDRDRPRGKKPEKTLKVIREKAKLLLLKKEEAAKEHKRKRIRIQTSARHLQKLANAAPSASDIQKKYHDSILKQRELGQRKRKRKREEMERKKRMRKVRNRNVSDVIDPPALEGLSARNMNEPPLKRRRKSSRIELCGKKRRYIEAEIEQYINYQFEFAIVSNWNEFMKSDILRRYNKDILSDYDAFKAFFSVLFIGLHVDIEDEYHEWYEGIIQNIRITKKTESESNDNSFESDSKTQSLVNKSENKCNDCDVFSLYNIRVLVHFKNFSAFWDSWIELPSSRISVLRTYSNAYDVHDNVKPLAECIRELDESQIVSIDFISSSLNLERDIFVKWINSEHIEWNEPNTVDMILKWTKNFLLSNKEITVNNEQQNVLSSHQRNNKRNTKFMMISRDYFVKAGNYASKCDHMICEAVLPNTLNVELCSLRKEQIEFVQDTVIHNLKNKKCDYFTMSNQCGIPLGLFQQIAFGITDLLPQFIIDQVMNWAKGIHLENLDHAIKEEQLFYVKIE